MNTQLAAAFLVCVAFTGCAHGRCQTLGTLLGCDCISHRAQPAQEAPSVSVPTFLGGEKIDSRVDGFTLRAIQIAANDYRSPEPVPETPCWNTQPAQVYQALRRGDIIFVRIDYRPENCGEHTPVLDAGATYAVSVDGRILRRVFDGGPGAEEQKQGQPRGVIVPPSEVGDVQAPKTEAGRPSSPPAPEGSLQDKAPPAGAQ